MLLIPEPSVQPPPTHTHVLKYYGEVWINLQQGHTELRATQSKESGSFGTTVNHYYSKMQGGALHPSLLVVGVEGVDVEFQTGKVSVFQIFIFSWDCVLDYSQNRNVLQSIFISQ